MPLWLALAHRSRRAKGFTTLSGCSRRTFLQATGALAIGFSTGCWSPAQEAPTGPKPELPGSLSDAPRIDSWLEVSGDGSIRVFTGKLELGQGISIAVAQVAAEELGADIERVSVILADTGQTPNESYTAGSRSIEESATAVRYAAAAAREILLAHAADRSGLPPEVLELRGDRVVGRGQEWPLQELLQGASLRREVGTSVQLKPRGHDRYLGKSVGRKELPAMVSGGELYVSDLRFPAMLHARMVRPSAYGCRLRSFDDKVLEGMAGRPRVIRDGTFLAVVAEAEWACIKAADRLRQTCRWSTPPPLAGAADLRAWIAEAQVSTQEVEREGAVSGKASHSATYFKPYTMHASVGPSCAVARLAEGEMTVWSHTQGVFPLRGALSGLLGIPEPKVRVIGVPGPGCYGHNGADDVAADAALIARALPGSHIRLQWSRSDEHLWEPYGSAMLIHLSARLDDQGDIVDWTGDIRSDTHSTRPGGEASKLLAAGELEKPLKKKGGGFSGGAYRNSQPLYRIPNRRIDLGTFQGPLRVSALRALGGYGNVFALESFIDELALLAQRDPFEFRLAQLADPRAIAVLEKLRAMLKAEQGYGIAFARYKNQASYFAVAARMAAAEPYRVEKLWGVVEAGEIINPDGLKNQVEGGMLQAASWTLGEAVRFEPGGVVSRDWVSYPIARFPHLPRTEVVLLDRPDLPPLGAGETAMGPTAAAIANALYRSTGQRVRDLPLDPKQFSPGPRR